MRPKLVQFGAGNIGRSFIGQLFSRAGYEVVFVDIAEDLVGALNQQGRYRVVVRDLEPQELWVENVRAVHAADRAQVTQEMAQADIAATAVGAPALESVYPLVAAGLLRRRELRAGPLDILICENVRRGAEVFRAGLRPHLPQDFDLDAAAGLVETSIGKMVPLVSAQERRRDPLTVYAEAYNTLIVDGRAFKRPVPAVAGLEAKDNMAAYVDRKLFIHNLGHATAAWVGFVAHPDRLLMWQVLEDPRVRDIARGAMWKSGRALIATYPAEFDLSNQRDHIEDLLRRFANRHLGDTVYRVGRDLLRKLAPQERVIGALRLQQQQCIEAQATTAALAAALLFRGADEQGQMLECDARFAAAVEQRGPEALLREVCGLDPLAPADAGIIQRTSDLYQLLRDPGCREMALDQLAAAGRAAAPR